jgi:hypothetical protein
LGKVLLDRFSPGSYTVSIDENPLSLILTIGERSIPFRLRPEETGSTLAARALETIRLLGA